MALSIAARQTESLVRDGRNPPPDSSIADLATDCRDVYASAT